MTLYLYNSDREYRPRVYIEWKDAVATLLRYAGEETVCGYTEYLDSIDVSYELDADTGVFMVDDGPSIIPVEGPL